MTHAVSGKKSRSTPPDGGWGWVVVFGSFMVHVIADGISYSFGLFFMEIVDEFKASKQMVSLVGSILLGVTYGMGPLASVFIAKFGCRAGTITGSVIATIGFAGSYYATDVYFLCGSIGIVGGVGLGLMYLPAIVSVSSYFEKRLSLATGIAVCGSGLGTFALAPIFDKLIAMYGWRVSTVIAAGALLSCTIFGALFKPLPVDRRRFSIVEEKRYSITMYRRASLPASVILGAIQEDEEADFEDEKPSAEIDSPSGDRQEKMFQDLAKFQASRRGSIQDHQAIAKSIAGNRRRSRTVTSSTVAPPDDDDDQGSGCLHNIKTWKGFQLLSNPVFVFVAILTFFIDVGYNVPFIYMADLTKETLNSNDPDDRRLGWVVSAIGISSTVSRIILGYISDKKGVNRFFIYCFSLMICGAATAISPIGTTFSYLISCASMFGFLGGVYISLTSVILIDLIGAEYISEAFGIVLFFQGMGSLVGPPIVGALYDYYHHYHLGFLTAGLCVGASGALLLLVPLIQKCGRTNSLDIDSKSQHSRRSIPGV